MENRFTAFEDRAAGIITILSGLVLAAVALLGPLAFNVIHYRTSPSGIRQGQGQDLVNLLVALPIAGVGGILALARSPRAARWIAFMPIYLMYTALAFGVGMEWSDPRYSGNSEKCAFLFVFELMAGLILLLYAAGRLSTLHAPRLGRRGKIAYSTLFVLLLSAFAVMWGSSLLEIMRTGSTASYDEARTGFWTVRILDLGISIPLGFLSVFLMWTRPETGYRIQLLFYGFFILQITAVLGMIAVMIAGKDPGVTAPQVAVFASIAVLVYSGYAYVTKRRTELA